MRGFVSSAPGKLVLSGEYAVLEGAPALVTAIDRRARIRFEQSGTGPLLLSAEPLGLKAFPILEDHRFKEDALGDVRARLVTETLALIFEALPLAREAMKSGHLSIDTTEMSLSHGGAKLGVGSSAAVAAALVGGIGSLIEVQPMKAQRVFELAHGAHLRFQHGRGSGIDVAASSFGGVLSFCRPAESAMPTCTPRAWPRALKWTVVGTGVAASTSEFLTKLRTWKDEDHNKYNGLMGELERLSREAVSTTPLDWVDWSLRWCEILERLGNSIGAPIMSEQHLNFRDFAQDNGLGYKPSGAGGGDAGFFVVPENRSLDEVGTLLNARNIHMLPLSPDASGVTIESLESSESQG